MVVLSLYRQVGLLALRLGPRAALENAQEGPVGKEATELPGLLRRGSEVVAFGSPRCGLCPELEQGFARRPAGERRRARGPRPPRCRLGRSPRTAQRAPLRGACDPTVSGSVVARTVSSASRGTGRRAVERRLSWASSPAVDGDDLPSPRPQGIEVVRWRTGQEVARVTGPVIRPGLAWPILALVRLRPTTKTLEFLNLKTHRRTAVTRVGRLDDLGRPSV